MDLLAELGQREDEHYQREVKIVGRIYADVAFVDQRRIIECYGPVHFAGFAPDGEFSERDVARIGRMEQAGWHVTILTTTDLRPEHREATRARLRAYLGLDTAPPERPWITPSKAVREGFYQMKARRDTWRHASL